MFPGHCHDPHRNDNEVTCSPRKGRHHGQAATHSTPQTMNDINAAGVPRST